MKTCYFWSVCVSLMFAIIFSGHANATDTVALISDVSGNVTVKTNSGSSSAKLLAIIPLGAIIDLPAGAKLTMIYVAKGDEYKLSGPGNYQIDATLPQTIKGATPSKQASLGGALSGKKIRLENVTQATLTMRGIKKIRSFESIAPLDSITLAAPLKFSWREPATGLTYQVQLIDSQNKVLISKEVMGNTFTLPQEISLSSGDYYVWNLSTTTPDGYLVTSSAKIRIASDETRAQAAKLKPEKGGTVSERVAYGLWLEGENLAYEARMYWDELASEFPDQMNVRNRAVIKP